MISHPLKDWLVIGLVGGGSGAVCGYSVWSVIEGWSALRWPSVEGEITASSITSIPGRFGNYYKPTVTYSYSVFGITHTGKRLRFGDAEYSFRFSAQKRLAPYAVGTSVQVHYHPDDPSRCVLVPGVELHDYVQIAWSGAFFLLAVGALAGVVH